MPEEAVQCKLITTANKKAKTNFNVLRDRGYTVEVINEKLVAIYFDFVRYKLRDAINELDFSNVSQFILTKNKLYFLIKYLSSLNISCSLQWDNELEEDLDKEYKNYKFQIDKALSSDQLEGNLIKLIEFIEHLEEEEFICFESITFHHKGSRVKMMQSGIIYYEIDQKPFIKEILNKAGLF